MLFEGKCFEASEVIANRDAMEWFLAQDIEKGWRQEEKKIQSAPLLRWEPPKQGWKMCNVGYDFDKTKRVVVGDWVLRNERGGGFIP